MKAGLFSFAGVTLLQLVVARAAFHQKHQHLHDKRAPAVVYETVTDSEYVYYDSVDVVVYKDAEGHPVSTVTSWKGEKQVSTSVSTSHTPPPPPPTTTSSSSPPPPPPSSSSSAAPPPPSPVAEEKLAEPVHHQAPPNTPPAASPAPQSSSPPPQSSSGSSTGGGSGAKGVAYNQPSQVDLVSGVVWACNWGQQNDLNHPNIEFVPQLWGKKDGMCESFYDNAKGAKHAFFYNEPDMPLSVGGSQVDYPDAVADFKTYMVPLQELGVKISTPCVANSDKSYLEDFLSHLPQGVTADILCFHWYGGNLGDLTNTVEQFKQTAQDYGIEQVWINEWAVQPPPPSLSSFTEYLDGAVDRYAYNMNDLEGSTGY